MALELNLEGLRESARRIKAQELEEEAGDDVKLVLQMPDGQENLATFKMGTLVSYIKAYIHNEYGLAMGKMSLQVQEKPMLDPLCLADIPYINISGVNFIKVAVDE